MRLIDADSINTKTFVDFVGDQKYINFNDALWMISEQPTAYDVDAVVEELEQSKKPIIGVKFDSSVPENERALSRYGFNSGIDKAIEIIRKGGVK